MKLIALTLFAAALWGQEAKPMPSLSLATPPPRMTTRVMEFILDDGEKMQKIAQLFAHRLHRIQVEPSVGLVVMTGTEADVLEVESAIKRYYKPKPLEAGISGPPNRNFELVLQVLHASSTGTQTEVPTALQPVVQQLKQLTNLTSFRTVESEVIRIRSGERFETTGILQWPGVPDPAIPVYQFRTTVQPKGVLIQCDRLVFSARIPVPSGPNNQVQFGEIVIQTAVDLKPGQATIIGKASASSKDGALILVLTAKLVD